MAIDTEDHRTKSRNPAQEDYDRKFNDIARNLQHQEQQAANPERVDDDSQHGYDREFDDMVDNGNLRDMKDAEQNPSEANPFNYQSSKNDDEDEEDEADDKRRGRWRTYLSSKRRVAAAGGLGLVLSVGGLGALFGLFEYNMPKIIANAEERRAKEIVDRNVDQAIQHEEQVWVTKYLLPGIKGCGNLKKIDCLSTYADKNMPKTISGKLYHTWQSKKALQVLNDSGLELTWDQKAGIYHLKVPSDSGEGYEIKDFRNRYTVSKELNRHIEFTGRFKYIKSRLFSKYMNTKYGTPLCNFFCDQSEATENSKLKIVTAIQKFRSALVGLINERIIAPSAGANSILFECIFNANSCNSPEKMRDRIKELKPGTAQSTVDDLVKKGQDIREKGLARSVAEEAMESLSNDTLKKVLGDSVPVVGEILMALQASQFMLDAAAIVTGTSMTMIIIANAMRNQEAISSAQVVQTAGSEKSGVNATTNTPAASFANAKLFEGYGDSTLFQYMFGTRSLPNTPTRPSNESCANGKAIPEGQPTCFRYDKQPPIVELVNTAIPGLKFYSQVSSPARVVLDKIMGLINWPLDQALMRCTDVHATGFASCAGATAGANIPLALALLALKPLVGDLGNWALKVLRPLLMQGNYLAFGTFYKSQQDAHGANLFNASMAGMDWGVFSLAKNAYGAAELSPAQAQQLTMEADQEERNDIRVASLSSRLFSFDNQYSLVSRIVINSPMSQISNAGVHNIVALLNPIKLVASGFSGFSKAHAAPVALTSYDRYGIPSMGWTSDDPCITQPDDTPEDKADLSPHLDEDKTDAVGEPLVKSANCDLFHSNIVNTVGGNGYTDESIPDPTSASADTE